MKWNEIGEPLASPGIFQGRQLFISFSFFLTPGTHSAQRPFRGIIRARDSCCGSNLPADVKTLYREFSLSISTPPFLSSAGWFSPPFLLSVFLSFSQFFFYSRFSFSLFFCPTLEQTTSPRPLLPSLKPPPSLLCREYNGKFKFFREFCSSRKKPLSTYTWSFSIKRKKKKKIRLLLPSSSSFYSKQKYRFKFNIYIVSYFI